jgi:hypothetical protein
MAVAGLLDELKRVKDKEFFLKRIRKFDDNLRNSQNSIISVLKAGKADFGYAMITTGLPMALSSFSVIGMTGDPWNFQAVGQSALLGVVAALADHTRNRRSSWSSKEASYWLSLHSAFKDNDGVRLRLPSFHRKFEEFMNDMGQRGRRFSNNLTNGGKGYSLLVCLGNPDWMLLGLCIM